MPVWEMLERIPSRELTDWQAYYEIEPWGQERIEWMLAMVASVLYNMLRAQGSPTMRTEDFLPVVEKEPDEETMAEVARERLRGLAAALKGEV